MDSTISQEEINNRKYISLACKNCRDKHRRCDGKNPCNRCTAINVKCIYTETKPRGGYRRRNPEKQSAARTTTIQAPAANPSMPLPNQELSIYIDYYASIHTKNSDSWDNYRIPSSLANLTIEQKFRVSATLSVTALTLGHLTQGHMLLDHAKSYLPQVMSSSSMDVLNGFGALAQSHTMEFDYVASSNYVKIAKNIANLLWKLHRHSKTNNGIADKVYLTLMEGFVGGKLFYLKHLPDRSTRTLKKALRSLEDLEDLILEISSDSLEVLSFIKGMYSIGLCYDLENIFGSIKTVETLAMKYSPALKDNSLITVHYANVLKYALLDDVVEMRIACQNLIKMYDGMLNYNTLSLALLSSTTLMWYALGLSSELTQLLSIAHRMSMFFPGCKVICERFTQGNVSEVAKWNPFTGIREKFQAISSHRDLQNQQHQNYNTVVMHTDYSHLEPLSSYSSSDSPSSQCQQINQEYRDHNHSDILNQESDMNYIQEDYLFDPLY